MIEWTRCKLGEIGRIRMCKRILKEQTSLTGDIPFYKISTFGREADCYITKELFEEYKKNYSFPQIGDILISAAGTLGKTVIFDGKDAYFQDSNIVWLDNDETVLCNDYLYYFYQTNPWIKTMGSTIGRLYNDNISETVVFFPTKIKKQKDLVSILKLIDSAIENNSLLSSTLEETAKTLYDYWFTQFDFPNEEGKPYRSSGGRMVWNEELKREIPEGWKVGTFGDLIDIGNGKDHSHLENGNIPVYGTGGLMRKVNNSLYNGESVLFPRKGSLNNVMYVNEAFWTVDTMFYSIPKSEHVAFYIYRNAQNVDFNRLNTGTGVPSMTSTIIKQLKIVIPDFKILERFDGTIQKLYKQIFKITEENEYLSSVRDYLLPLLMNGQVTIED